MAAAAPLRNAGPELLDVRNTNYAMSKRFDRGMRDHPCCFTTGFHSTALGAAGVRVMSPFQPAKDAWGR